MQAILVHGALVGCALLLCLAYTPESKLKPLLHGMPLALLLSFAVFDWLISVSILKHNECLDMPDQRNLPLVAATIFCTLIVICCTRLLLSGQTRQLSVFFSLSTSLMFVVTFGQMHVARGSGTVAWRTPAFGSYLFPSRCNLVLHSFMSQVLATAATPRIIEAHGLRHVLRRTLDVYLAMLFGSAAVLWPLPTAHEPHLLAPPLLLMGLALGFGLHTLHFMWRVLPLTLGRADKVADTCERRSTRIVCLRLLHGLIVFAWLAFPSISVASALRLLSAETESLLLSATAISEGVVSALVLQYGTTATAKWEEREEARAALETSRGVAHGFKVFTQCVGHDLRTPLQALVFANLRSLSLIATLARGVGADLAMDEGHSAASVHLASPGDARRSSDSNSIRSGDGPAIIAGATPSAIDSATSDHCGDCGCGASSGLRAESADRHAACNTASATPTSAPSAENGEARAAQALPATSTPVSVQQRAVVELRRKLTEVGACAELLTCIVANIWDFEKLGPWPPWAGPRAPTFSCALPPYAAQLIETTDGTHATHATDTPDTHGTHRTHRLTVRTPPHLPTRSSFGDVIRAVCRRRHARGRAAGSTRGHGRDRVQDRR